MTCIFGDLKDKYEVLLRAIIYRKSALINEGQQSGPVGVENGCGRKMERKRQSGKKGKERGKRSMGHLMVADARH